MGLSMTERKKIEDRIRKKEQEIQDLNAKVREARVYIQALQDVLKMLPREDVTVTPHDASQTHSLRPGSGMAQVRDAIIERGHPLHISALLEKLGKSASREARISLSSSLAAYVRKGEVFTRTGPNTFGLIELGHTAPSSGKPPAEFGLESN